jgi:hypothetical protein
MYLSDCFILVVGKMLYIHVLQYVVTWADDERETRTPGNHSPSTSAARNAVQVCNLFP